MRRKDREITDIKQIAEIIKKCKTCRLAMVDSNMPYVVPLNFGYEIESQTLTLYFHSANDGKKLDILRKNNNVCFEMDCEGELIHVENPCNSGYFFESVIGFGNVKFVDDIAEKCNALTLLMQHQVGQDFTFTQDQCKTVCVYKIVTDNFTGKKKIKQQN